MLEIMFSRGCLWLLTGAFVAAWATAVAADDERDVPSAERGGTAPPVELELLLKLPDSYAAGGELRGGASRSEWRARFFGMREKLDERRDHMQQLQTKMEGMAGDSSTWAVGAPGLSAPDPQISTLNYKLRQDLRRAREDVVLAERELRELRIEADLADVPATWRE